MFFLIHLRFCGLLSRWREEDFINAKQPPGVDAHVFQLLVDHKVTSQQGALWLPLSLCLSTSLPSFPYYICLRVYPPICLAFSLPLYLSTYNNAINSICRASCFHESLASLGSGVIGLQSACCWEASVERSPSHLVNWKSSIPQTNQMPNLCFTHLMLPPYRLRKDMNLTIGGKKTANWRLGGMICHPSRQEDKMQITIASFAFAAVRAFAASAATHLS